MKDKEFTLVMGGIALVSYDNSREILKWAFDNTKMMFDIEDKIGEVDKLPLDEGYMLDYGTIIYRTR